MLKTNKMLLGMIGLLLVSVIIWGCSINSSSSISNSPESSDIVSTYFPVTAGYITTYEITSADGYTTTATFEMGEEVSFNGTTAFEWFVNKDSKFDTSYFEVTDDALYFWENRYSNREKILQLPLEVGNTWNRYATSGQQGDDGSDDGWWGYNDPQDKGEEIDGPEADKPIDGANKNFPTVGSVAATVIAVENIELKNGDFFSNAVRVQIVGSQGSHYYWFVPDVGLVKYVIGASDIYDHDGSEKGELVEYGSK